MSDHRTTNYHDHVPIHRLNTPQTKLWLFGGDIRRRMASNLSKKYPSGVGVCSATLRLIAYVDPRGGIRELMPPHKLYKMHEVSNQPMVTECQCASFFDPEVGGPWRERDTYEHHPMCQFDRVSAPVYQHMMNASPGRRIVGLDDKGNPVFADGGSIHGVRPDEAIRQRKLILTG